MRARKEMRKYVNRMRKRYGKKNGVLGCWVFDFGPRGPWSDKRNEKGRQPVRASGQSRQAPGKEP